MIAVTGEPRSGTSVTMAIVKELGYRIAGQQYVAEDHDANPDGVWELPRIAKNGLSWDMYCGKTNFCDNLTQYDAIKLISYGLTSSSARIFSEVIVCVRNPLEVCQSQWKVGYRPVNKSLLMDYIYNQQALMKWLGQWVIPFTVVNYNELIKNPEWEISGLCGFLTAKRDDRFTSEDIMRAKGVIKPQYYRNQA